MVMTEQIILDIPSESLLSLNLSAEEASRELLIVAAVKLFELGKLSSGAAAQLAGIPKSLFLAKLAVYGADFLELSKDDFER